MTRQTRLTVIALACGALAGCMPTLPPPTETISEPVPGLTVRTVCPKPSGVRHFSLSAEHPLTAVLECSPETATFVVFNQYQVRVRTIRLMADGRMHDEVSYLCPDPTPAEETLQAVQRSLASTAATSRTSVIELTTHSR